MTGTSARMVLPVGVRRLPQRRVSWATISRPRPAGGRPRGAQAAHAVPALLTAAALSALAFVAALVLVRAVRRR